MAKNPMTRATVPAQRRTAPELPPGFHEMVAYLKSLVRGAHVRARLANDFDVTVPEESDAATHRADRPRRMRLRPRARRRPVRLRRRVTAPPRTIPAARTGRTACDVGGAPGRTARASAARTGRAPPPVTPANRRLTPVRSYT
ncbi:hypothetical protein AB0D98_23055 [Streptomyces sp. NPDC047987]|uniref:hypothetical protein n=1 Tax=unclassified Streptomyces TaxID=2593676 RepID=UPI0034361CE0